jgi:RHS repeat-associated protein
MAMPGRSLNSSDYRYGFNGKEKDVNGLGGGGSTYDYGFRIYNPQIAKFLSVDPLFKTFPFYTPYQYASNMPILAIDIDGLESSENLNNTERGWYIDNHGDYFYQYPSKPLPTGANLNWKYIASTFTDINEKGERILESSDQENIYPTASEFYSNSNYAKYLNRNKPIISKKMADIVDNVNKIASVGLGGAGSITGSAETIARFEVRALQNRGTLTSLGKVSKLLDQIEKSPISKFNKTVGVASAVFASVNLSVKALSNNMTVGDVVDGAVGIGLGVATLSNPFVLTGVLAYGVLDMYGYTPKTFLEYTKLDRKINTSRLIRGLKGFYKE